MASSNDSLSGGRYVPVHRRNSSASTRPLNVPNPLVYSREALLLLAPPTHTHGVNSTPNSPNANATFEAASTNSEPHLGWERLNEAMRNYLRATCPEIAMNRKMRKSLEYHFIQHRAATRQHNDNDGRRSRSRESSRHSSSSPSSSPTTEELPSTPIKLAPAPKSNRLQLPAAAAVPTTAEALKRSRSPTPRRVRHTNSRTRHANFTQLNRNAAVLASGKEGNWRVRQTGGVFAPLPTVTISSA
ncbi:hypothetical protein FA15DRAFT_664620 [Coprinopsis marcescibilis]|uniref:Uncharacterized protein n=1 Tax=Coprinopsis marcescibilis TaxID=230819 RepID=A0A5C3L887_COPMA|nr:hypothetical protein FA15DRAFT_664620 [Coprinopsis marcescibilis]